MQNHVIDKSCALQTLNLFHPCRNAAQIIRCETLNTLGEAIRLHACTSWNIIPKIIPR